MFIECRHIMPSGRKCKSPTLRGMVYCYFHTNIRRFEKTIGKKGDEPLLLPSLEDTSGIQIALHQVLGGLASARLDPSHVSLYLRGLNIAARLVTKPDPPEVGGPVQDLYYENDEVLARAEEICEIPDDCLECTRHDDCENFANSGYELQQPEEPIPARPDEEDEIEDFKGDAWKELKERVNAKDN